MSEKLNVQRLLSPFPPQRNALQLRRPMKGRSAPYAGYNRVLLTKEIALARHDNARLSYLPVGFVISYAELQKEELGSERAILPVKRGGGGAARLPHPRISTDFEGKGITDVVKSGRGGAF